MKNVFRMTAMLSALGTALPLARDYLSVPGHSHSMVPGGLPEMS